MWAKLLEHQVEGQGLAEYAVILVFVAVVVMVIVAVLGPQVGNMYSQISSGFPSPP